ncbi:pilin [Patescibacteria group bacterium]|nr:pilin [Patescibacteria group bacterium]
MKFKSPKLLFTVNCLLLIVFALPAVAADGLVPCSGPNCTVCSFLQLISNVIMFIVRDITAPLAGLLFLIGGIMMVSAGGSEARLKKGKEIFKNTAIGVLIILASWAIVNTLITTFGSNVAGFVPGNWWQVNCR